MREPEEPEANPFRNYRHTASVVALPVFACALLLLLAFVQPTLPGEVGLWVWCATGIAVMFALLWIVGRAVVRMQARKGNPHFATLIGRRYMLLVFISAVSGVLGVAGLAVCVVGGWIRLNIGILLPGMLAALTLALAAAGIAWHTLGKPKGERP